MLVRHCDICGEIIKDTAPKEELIICGRHVRLHYTATQDIYEGAQMIPDEQIDLCTGCARALQETVNRRKEKVECK